MSLLAKAIIGISGAAVLTTGVVLWTGSDSDDNPAQSTKKEVVQAPSVKDTPEQNQALQPEFIANNTGSNTASNEVSGVPVNDPMRQQMQPNPNTPSPSPIDVNSNVGGPLDPVIKVVDPVTKNNTSTEDEERERAALQEARRKDSLELAQSNITQVVEATQSVDPIVEDPDIVRAEEIEISFPNVFTPNGDRINDTYYIESSNVEFKNFEFVVYDQRGNVVMISKEADFQWTAMNPQTGMYLEKGMYAYVMIGETVDGIQCKKSGTITINE
mmetsp:Transcript_29924/g.39788  ORF Transcript_29924/g.39788 Transcript_29924/m.39788 type:complete len:272 (-) Transcript_29924:165-980(-)